MSDLTQKRLRRFYSKPLASLSLWLLLVLVVIGLTADLWANSKPVVMSYEGRLFFPAVVSYHPSDFGKEGLVTNYRVLTPEWALWPVVAWDPFESNPSVHTYPSPPSPENWLGTDDRGRDVLARLIHGFRYSMAFAVLIWVFAYTTGMLFGAVTGFLGGWVDLIASRVVEVFDSLPYLLVLLTLVALIGASLPLLVGFAVAIGWMRISIYMRAEFLRLRHREFVESARAQGLPTWRLIWKHILPNAIGPIVTFSPAEIATGIYTLAMLDYLGLGLPAPTPSWGELLQQAQNEFTIAWWLAVYPAAAMVLIMSLLTFIGDGLRYAFSPR